MPNEDQVVQIFKKLDAATALDIVIIIFVAALMSVAAQRALFWVGNRLQGKKRLNLLAMVPFIRLVII